MNEYLVTDRLGREWRMRAVGPLDACRRRDDELWAGLMRRAQTAFDQQRSVSAVPAAGEPVASVADLYGDAP